MSISAVILTKNEEKNIEDCLKLLSFCNEVIVIDDNSTDRTVNIAKKYKAIVYTRNLASDFSKQKNYGLEKATCRWCLFVDADERVLPELKQEIIKATSDKNNNIIGFYLKRIDFIWGKKLNHGENANFSILRLARRRAGKWMRQVHEYWQVFGKKKTLKGYLYHYPHPTLKEFINKLNNYSTLHAEANKYEHKKSSLIKIIFYPILKFLKNYFLQLGFLDSKEGLVMALMMSFHSFLSWSKLWITQKKQFLK